MTVEVFLNAMQGDKKVQSGRIRYILLASLGVAVVVGDVSESEIAACL
jgi:3-dehydroquinate synthetase